MVVASTNIGMTADTGGLTNRAGGVQARVGWMLKVLRKARAGGCVSLGTCQAGGGWRERDLQPYAATGCGGPLWCYNYGDTATSEPTFAWYRPLPFHAPTLRVAIEARSVVFRLRLLHNIREHTSSRSLPASRTRGG